MFERSGRGRHRWTGPISVGFALVLVMSIAPTVTAASPAAGAVTDPASEDSIQHQEYLSHESRHYEFAPGGPATIGFTPRPGDSATVDGAAAVALPGASGGMSARPSGTIKPLRREVFGFLPYWELGSTLDYDTLSTVAYFGVNINSDGSLYTSGNGWSGWNSSTLTTAINDAHSHGTRVVLTAESFAWGTSEAATQTALLSSAAARLNAAQVIAAAVRARGVDGVDLDFEPIASGQKANYVEFVKTLRIELDKVQPGYELTFCANGAPNTYDLPNLLAAGAADAVFIMGYNLRGSGAVTAGSIDPLTSSLIRYDLTNVTANFTSKVSPSKVILGLPWYGAAYSTGTKKSLNAAIVSAQTYGKPVESPYSTLSGLAAQSDSTHLGKFYDSGEQTAWTAYYGTFGGQATWREAYFDDAESLGVKCDAIDGWGLRGVGIWALGYDNNNGKGDLTAEIAVKFETGVAGTTYHPLTPVRLLDTRKGSGSTGKLKANVPRTFQVAGLDGVDASATAVTGTVTVTNATNSWALYIGPYPLAKPTSATIDFKKGATVANGITLGLGLTGSLSATYMSSSGNTADLVFDLTGYFTPDGTGATYHAIQPARLLDTRKNVGISGKIKANTPTSFKVAGVGGVDANARAVTGNVTATGSTAGWAVYLGPDPQIKPSSSTINFSKGQTLASNVTVALSPSGTLSATYMSAAGNKTDLVFDVTGYYSDDATGLRFVPITPARLLDTRAGIGLAGKLKANTPRTFPMAGRVSLPSTAQAISGNLTVINETSSWAVYAGPTPMAKPTSSTLNFARGDLRTNGLTVLLGGTPGGLSVTYMSRSGNTMDLVLDVTGYYVP
jgi:spore germination protein YaaH